ncbi:MAG TPA: MBOAT family O-acyltransferase [Bacteroidales bacterium]|nr:MBOAT family O-acyltransferase [Bacteroidales bacterium]
MIFTSVNFFLFLVLVLVAYYLVPVKYRKPLLLVASAFFYAIAGYEYLLLVIALIISNYYLGLKLEKTNNQAQRKFFLHAGLIINIGVLVFYKYLGFIFYSIIEVFGIENHGADPGILKLIIPLGLSYYTFQNLGYILDIYRGSEVPEKNLVNFSLFVLFFPKLNVGPIERVKTLLPQIRTDRVFSAENLIEGGKRILWGFFKKMVIADRIAIFVDAVYVNHEFHGGSTMLLAILLYTLQVYADFSGYTDIAIGTARLFGYRLMENFNFPLVSKNISDFWRRWHISLSTWVNDYMFNPISLKRRNWGNLGVYYALFISFIVVGIWHGATWNYVLFGVFQSLALIYDMATRRFRKKVSKKVPSLLYSLLSIALTYIFISFCLILFKTPTPEQALSVLQSIASPPGDLSIDRASMILFITIGGLVLIISDFRSEFKFLQFPQRINNNWIFKQVSYAVMLIYLLVAGVFDGGQFIYFQF